MRLVSASLLVFGAALFGSAPPAGAQDEKPQAAQPEQPKSFWEQDQLLGDLGGLRDRLGAAGITFTLQEQSELIGNATGGLRRGATYDGATLGTVVLDTGKAFGLDGGKLDISAYQIHGRSPTTNLVGSLQTVTSIDATRATRLYNLYYEQSLLNDALSIRIGQFGADDEFIANAYGAVFINSTFGWPALPALDLPSGGPAYPLTTPGVRLRYKPTSEVSLYAAVFNGNPAGIGPGDPQLRDNSGTVLHTNAGAFVISEIQYAINQGDDAKGLPGTYKFGGWLDTNRFADQEYDSAGLPLSSALSSGVPRQHRNDWSLYALFDQLVWRPDGAPKDHGIGLFGRIMGAPGDRNIANFYVDGGIDWKAPFADRPDDSVGLGIGYVGISPSVRAYDRAVGFYSGMPYPIASHETLIEATYLCQATGWLQLQPDIQYVINPGGHVPNPLSPGHVIKDAVVLGLRATVVF